MLVEEFDNEFDILYNNISSNTAPGLDRYEKSVLLTQSQEGLVQSLYNGDFVTDSFESTEEATRFLNELIKESRITSLTPTPSTSLRSNSSIATLPSNLWYIVYEEAIDSNGRHYSIQPVSHDKFFREANNPFRNNSNYHLLRITKNNVAEILHSSNVTLSTYIVRYIEKPSPIVLCDLGSTESVDGVSVKTECALNKALHRKILMRAVMLAKSLYSNDRQNTQ